MTNEEKTINDEGPKVATPSKLSIVKATGLAGLAALVILFAAVLPVEYGIDVFGAGEALGLTALSKQKDAEETVTTKEQGVYKAESVLFQEHATTITLNPREGLEYKFRMEEGSSMLYMWQSDKVVAYEFHGEPQDDPTGYFQSYEKENGTTQQGGFVSPFLGTQGWYWENKTNEPVTIQLETVGYFEVVGDPKKPITQ